MKITMSEPDGPYGCAVDPGVMDVDLTEVFTGVSFTTEDGERLGVCMRDSGFEVHYWGDGFNSGWFSFQNGSATHRDPSASDPPDQESTVEIGGQVMAQAQFDAARFPLLDAADLAGENERLRRWKSEATEVLKSWHEVHEALGEPGPVGSSIAGSALEEVRRVMAENERLRAELQDRRTAGQESDG